MTTHEAQFMQQHAGYWRDLSFRRMAVIFGPVADPQGTWGLAIVEVEGKNEAQDMCTNDPIMTAGIGFRFEIYDMPSAVLRQ